MNARTANAEPNWKPDLQSKTNETVSSIAAFATEGTVFVSYDTYRDSCMSVSCVKSSLFCVPSNSRCFAEAHFERGGKLLAALEMGDGDQVRTACSRMLLRPTALVTQVLRV